MRRAFSHTTSESGKSLSSPNGSRIGFGGPAEVDATEVEPIFCPTLFFTSLAWFSSAFVEFLASLLFRAKSLI